MPAAGGGKDVGAGFKLEGHAVFQDCVFILQGGLVGLDDLEAHGGGQGVAEAVVELTADMPQQLVRASQSGHAAEIPRREADTEQEYRSYQKQYVAWFRNHAVSQYRAVVLPEPDRDTGSWLNYRLITKDMLSNFYDSLRKTTFNREIAKKRAALAAAGKDVPEAFYSEGTMAKYRSALLAFLPTGFKFSDTITAFLKDYARRYKNQCQQRKKKGPVDVFAKTHIPWDLYTAICETCLTVPDGSGVSDWLFASVCFNLFCRCTVAAELNLYMLSPTPDGFLVDLAATKTTLGGDKVDKKNLTGNPNVSAVSIRLALAVALVLWVTTTDKDQEGRLFCGGNQATTFGNRLQHILKSDKCKAALAKAGIDPRTLGTHSFREGGATWVTYGSQPCNAAAVCQRGGWSLGINEGNFKWDKEGGDNFLAYKAAGRDEKTLQFALVGPFFKDPAGAAEAAEVDAAVEECFPAVLTECRTAACVQVCKDSLAVLFHHHDFLFDNCPYMRSHPCMDPKYAHLRRRVFVGYEGDEDCPTGHKPRGIPDFVASRIQAEKVVREEALITRKLLQELAAAQTACAAKASAELDALSNRVSTLQAEQSAAVQGRRGRAVAQDKGLEDSFARIAEAQAALSRQIRAQSVSAKRKQDHLAAQTQELLRKVTRRLDVQSAGAAPAPELGAQGRGGAAPAVASFDAAACDLTELANRPIVELLRVWWLGTAALGIPALRTVKRSAFAGPHRRMYSMWKKVAQTVWEASGLEHEPRTSLDLVHCVQHGMCLINANVEREMSGRIKLSTLYDKTRKWKQAHVARRPGE